MAVTNHERVGKALELLKAGLGPFVERDVDGPNALPLRIDGDVPNLGKFAASRRVARTVYLGSAPIEAAANRGLEDRRIRLGCVMPGESPAIFGDALRRLSTAATISMQITLALLALLALLSQRTNALIAPRTERMLKV